MNNWNRIFKPIVVLGVICVVVTGALAATNSVTGPIITAAIEAAETAARTELLPEADSFTEVKDIAVENVSGIYTADNGAGAVITASGKGYGGDVVVMVAFGPCLLYTSAGPQLYDLPAGGRRGRGRKGADMRRKTARLLLSGGVLAAVLSGGAAALSGGDGLVSLRDLNEVFLPKAQTQMEERMDSALQSTYDQALAQVQGESGGGGGLYSADLRLSLIHISQGDAVGQLPPHPLPALQAVRLGQQGENGPVGQQDQQGEEHSRFQHHILLHHPGLGDELDQRLSLIHI